MAEQMAAKATRTWSEAKKATAARHRDRGFGAVKAKGRDNKCWNCGGDHFQSTCPDLRNKGHPKAGKGKSNFAMDPYYDDYYQSKGFKGKKGKNRSFSKGKNTYSGEVDYDVMYSKGKWNHSQKQHVPRPAVNVYAQEFYGLDMELQRQQQDSTSPPMATPSTMGDYEGMIDCGATASAAPEVAVKGLIQAIVAQDRSARVQIDESARPYFLYGNGKWGRAWYQVHLSSDVSGTLRSFSIYALPNPPKLHQPWFNRSMLVPILIGMDHLGPQGAGMMIDFNTGMTLNSREEDPQPYQLRKNHKGHYVFDIREYLTGSKFNQTGSVHVQLQRCHRQSFMQDFVLEFHPVHLQHAYFWSASSCSDERTLHLMRRLQQASAQISMASTPSSLNSTPAVSSSIVVRTAGSNGTPQRRPGEVNGGAHQSSDSSQEACGRVRHGEAPGMGSERSEKQAKPMALLRDSCSGSKNEQSSCPMATVSLLQPKAELRSSEGQSSEQHAEPSPSDGTEDAGPTASSDGRCKADSSDLPGHDGESECGGEAHGEDHPGQEGTLEGFQANNGETAGSDQHCQHGRGEQADSGLQHRISKNVKWQLGEGQCIDSSDSTNEGHGGPQRLGESPHRGGAAGAFEDDSGAEEPSSRVNHGDGGRSMKKVPLHVDNKVLQFMLLMTTTLTTSTASLVLDSSDFLWEVACSNNSWLSEEVLKQGLSARRINYANGFDIYQKECWQRLRQLQREKKPKKIWFSLPCTRCCRFVNLNYSTPERKAVLETARRKERKMLKEAKDFILDALDYDPDLDIYFEWTHPCTGWDQ